MNYENISVCILCGKLIINGKNKFVVCNKCMEEKERIDDMTKQSFTKNDLRTGMVVTDRDGDIYTVLLGTEHGDILRGEMEYNPLSCYKEDLKNNEFYGSDIVKVENPTKMFSYLRYEDLELVWEREKESKTVELDIDEAREALQDKYPGKEIKIRISD